ncbi:hypothetical protein NKR19_g670 [Coniochaeta hoffmannii]|uniref:CFEM domain-containing protein n=1 Tax=Coniochaeta hoffmannii TaxID=91930 RepID=A0AA38RZZ1_9PEZI|nr:hypothetical protein NKR19_g670 [Coniochaeta hoffmannii]
MQSNHLMIALLATLVAAQDLSGLPACSAQCFTTALPKSKCADTTDFHCLCASKAFIDDVKKCAVKACKTKEQDITLDWARNECHDAGVGI